MEKTSLTKLFLFFKKYEVQIAVTIIFLSLLAAFFYANPRAFSSPHTYSSVLGFAPFVLIPALPLTYLIICGEIDLSFPSVMGLGSWIFSLVATSTGNPLLGLFAGLCMGGIAGLLNGILVTKVKISSLILTIGTMFMWSGVVMVGCQGRPISLLWLENTMFYKIFVGQIGVVSSQLIWAIILSIIFWLILNRHVFGAYVYFTGDNVVAARLMGINVDYVKTVCFILMGVFSSFSGILAALKMTNFWPGIGEGYMLLSIAATVVGGTPITGGYGTIYGTVIGAIMIQTITTGILSAGITGYWTNVGVGLTIVLALAVQSLLRKRRK